MIVERIPNGYYTKEFRDEVVKVAMEVGLSVNCIKALVRGGTLALVGTHKDFKFGIRKPLEEIKMAGWGCPPS